jgi:hypothetical protein
VFAAHYGGCISWNLPWLLSATKWVKKLKKRKKWGKEKRVEECRTRQMGFFFFFFSGGGSLSGRLRMPAPQPSMSVFLFGVFSFT